MLALLAHGAYHLIQLLVHLNHFSLCQLYPWIMTINIDKLQEQFISCTSFELFLDAIRLVL